MNKTKNVPSLVETALHLYDEEYYERGAIRGISGYMNYSWLPELTIRMVHHLIRQLNITETDRVLDFGCAKGYLVKALRILDINAYGVDISDYAINNCPTEVVKFCSKIESCGDPRCFEKTYDWLISKDVFEHIEEDALRVLLRAALPRVKRMFLAIPIGKDEQGTGFLIPEYDKDVTHITIKTASGWRRLFEESGWRVDLMCHQFRGIKENWVRVHPEGNVFFVLSHPDTDLAKISLLPCM